VELKKSTIGEGTKAMHLSYLGDAKIGTKSNIGAGTITCNYDGFHKYPTSVGNKVFIGSDTALVAPVRVGDGAYIAAGSTITENVPSDDWESPAAARSTNLAGRQRSAANLPPRSNQRIREEIEAQAAARFEKAQKITSPKSGFAFRPFGMTFHKFSRRSFTT